MSALRSLKITTSLYILFGVIVLLLTWQAVSSGLEAFQQKARAQHVVMLARANRGVFAALQAIRQERGPVVLALQAPDPASAELIGRLPSLRASGQLGLDAMMATCAQVVCSADDEVASLHDAATRLAQLRSVVDGALREPLAARPPGIAKDWNDATSRAVTNLDAISLYITRDMRLMDAEIGELTAIKEAAYVVRDAAGFIRTELQGAITAGAIAPERQTRLAMLHGQLDIGRKMLQDLAGRSGLPSAVTVAVKMVQDQYFDGFLKQCLAVEKALATGARPPVSADELVHASDKALDVLVGVSFAALDAMVTKADLRLHEADARLLLQVGLLVASLAVSLAGFLVAWRRVARPIGVFSAVMLRASDGDLSIDVPFCGRRDEIGVLARALDVFKRNAIARRDAEAEQEAERQGREERARRLEHLTRAFDGQAAELLASMSAEAGRMREMAEALAASAQLSSRQASAVAAASEQTSVNVQTVAEATEQLSTASTEIGRHINDAAAIARLAVEEARQTDAAVRKLADRAQRVDEVIGLISGIAAQTNLLALNATIEAARAGDAGKGFAIVASEVKTLATQTARATEEIRSQITEIRDSTHEAVEAIRRIAATIESIGQTTSIVTAAAEEQRVATLEIARNVQEAARGSHEVAGNISGVRQASGDVGNAASRVLDTAGSVTAASDRLRDTIHAFLGSVRAA